MRCSAWLVPPDTATAMGAGEVPMVLLTVTDIGGAGAGGVG